MRDRQQTMAIGVVVAGVRGKRLSKERGRGVRSSGGGYGGLKGAEKMKKRG